jgi:hypothetical protein
MAKDKNSIKSWEQKRRSDRHYSRLPQRKCYLIVTNGVTEAVYLKHYRISTGPIVKICKRVGVDPRKLVEKAILERDALIRQQDFDMGNDETWVVLDRDTNPADSKNKGQFNEALQIAQNNGLLVAYSNDAFELWFVLHYQDVTRSTHRNELYVLLEKHRGKKYEKGRRVDLYEELKPLRDDAMRRAAQLHKGVGEKAPEASNPCTTIYLLIEKLMSDPGFRG